jgi:hypothetical protein
LSGKHTFVFTIVICTLGCFSFGALVSYFAGSLLLGSFLTFLFSLLMWHLMFHAQKSNFGKKTPKLMDYSYLILGAFGLLGASGAEVTLREQLSIDAPFELEVMVQKPNFIAEYTPALERYCSLEKAQSSVETEISTIQREVGKARCRCLRSLFNWSFYGPILFNVEQVAKNCKRIYLYAPQAEDLGRVNMEEMLFQYAGMESFAVYEKMRQKEDWKSSRKWHSLTAPASYLLLAVALALRITKVSVEYFEWHTSA